MASHDLEKVDEIRRRLDASYEEALAALEESQGDLLRALAAVERKRKAAALVADPGALAERIVSLIQEGSVTGLRLKCGARVVKEIPVSHGTLGVVAASLLAGLLEQFSVEVIKGSPKPSPAPKEGESATL